ncbi:MULTISPECIES: MOSC N-terminal beta barrel domain-containing protein [unclassified Streptomyces]|uniref:MOSC N-terminal beta barrel domain-containing protein n=1 Tax=unclassified Streptomyces TaxID=2593676 RepID=UPI003322B9A1
MRPTHVHPVKALRGLAPRPAVVRPGRPAGDRRRALIDDGGKVVTRRVRPRPAPSAAVQPSGGGFRLSAPGGRRPTQPVPEPLVTVRWTPMVRGAHRRGRPSTVRDGACPVREVPRAGTGGSANRHPLFGQPAVPHRRSPPRPHPAPSAPPTSPDDHGTAYPRPPQSCASGPGCRPGDLRLRGNLGPRPGRWGRGKFPEARAGRDLALSSGGLAGERAGRGP